MSISANLPPTSHSVDASAAVLSQPSAAAAALAALDGARRQLENAHGAILALGTEKEVAAQQRDQTRAQLENSQLENANLGQQLLKLREDVEKLRIQFEEQRRAAAELNAQLESKHVENKGYAQRFEHQRIESEQLGVQLDKSRIENQNLMHQHAEFHERERVMGDENARLNHHVAQLVGQIEAHEDLSRAHATLRDEKREAEQANALLEIGVADLEQKLDQKEREKDELFAQILDLHDLQIDDLPTLIIEMARQLTGAEVGLFTAAEGDDVIASLGMDELEPFIADALFEFTRRVKTENAPIVENDGKKLPDGAGLVNLSALPVAAKGKESGVLLLANKRNGDFNEQDTKLLLSIGQHAGIALENVRLHHELNEAYASTIAVLADAIEAKDAYTRGHCESVMRLAVEVGRLLELKGEKLDEVRYSALLHDVGKIGVPDGILLKPGKLMAEEFLIIQKHPAIGRDLVSRVPTLNRLTDAILHHHEKWDGSGYPDGLAGEGIPLVARIVGAVDAFDAMTTPRPYRVMVSHEEALGELKRCAGTQFDPQIVNLIDQILHQGMEVNPEKHTTEHSSLLTTAKRNMDAEDENNPTLGAVKGVEDVPGADEIEGFDVSA